MASDTSRAFDQLAGQFAKSLTASYEERKDLLERQEAAKRIQQEFALKKKQIDDQIQFHRDQMSIDKVELAHDIAEDKRKEMTQKLTDRKNYLNAKEKQYLDAIEAGLNPMAEAIKLRKAEEDLYGQPITPMDRELPAPESKNAITPIQKEELFFKYQDRAAKFSQDFETVRSNVDNIQVATQRMLSNPDNINRIATDQAVITSFNKILDPTSVVRESEYARTPANTALINRAKGAIDKLSEGGAGLTSSDIVEIRNTALEMAELRREILNKKLEKQIRLKARRAGFGEEDIESIAPLYSPLDIGEEPPPSDSTGVDSLLQVLPKQTGKASWINQYNNSRR